MIKPYKKQTKTKIIESRFKDTPELKNEFGSLRLLLKKVLTEPYNITTPVNLEIVEDTLKVTLDLNHGFFTDQVINLKGSSDPLLDSEYRIVDYDTLSISLELPAGVSVLSEDISNITIEGAPLGYSVEYDDTDSGTTCFKNTSSYSPAILKVIDKLPPNEYDPSWGKFARVVIGNEVDSSGNFINDYKAPYHPEYPDAELTGDGEKGSTGIHGFAKWPYADKRSYDFKENYSPDNNYFPTDWIVIGDSISFYILIKTCGTGDSSSYSYNILGYGNYISDNNRESSNVCLQARDHFVRAGSNISYAPSRTRSFFGALDYDHSGFILSDVDGSNRRGYNRCRGVGDYLDSDGDRHTSYSKIRSFTKDGFLMSRLYIKDHENYIRGYYRGFYNYYGEDWLPHRYIDSNGLLILHVQKPESTKSYDKVPVVFDLKDWEKVK